MYDAGLPGFVRCLQDIGPVRGWAHQISCGAGLGSGLDFEEIFASLVLMYMALACENGSSCVRVTRAFILVYFIRHAIEKDNG